MIEAAPAVAYLRVSTARQGGDGLGIEAQRAAIRDWAERTGHAVISEHVEVESGRKAAREVAIRAIDEAHARRATLVVAKLDRLTREATMLARVQDRRVKFVVVDNPQATDLTIDILAAVAREEVRAIRDRTRAALAAKRARGEKMGGDARNLTQTGRDAGGATVRARAVAAYAHVSPLVLVLANDVGLGTAAIAARCNQEGMRTREGRPFTRQTIRRILRRLEAP